MGDRLILRIAPIFGHRALEDSLDVRIQVGVIILECQNIISTGGNDLMRNVLLCSHGVDGYDFLPQIQQFDQPRQGRDLIRFAVNGLLTQANAVLRCEGMHHMQRL